MPITINDCKCGQIVDVTPSWAGYELWIGCPTCHRTRQECIDGSEDFAAAVREWNRRNPQQTDIQMQDRLHEGEEASGNG